MKKETFVSLIKLCDDYVKKCRKFGEGIQKTYIDAGLERDFANPYAYEFPYGPLIDRIVKAIATDFGDKHYDAQTAEDFINWWIWECDFGREKSYKTVNGEFVSIPMSEVTFGGKTYIVNTPGQLYDTILKDKKFKAKQ